MTLTRYGPDAWLVRFADSADEAAFARSRRIVTGLERHPPTGLVEFVPAFTTVLLRFAAGTSPGENALRAAAEAWAASSETALASRVVEFPVHYAGLDLDRVAAHARLPRDEVIARHTAPTYRVHCLGFAPGFPYLGGLDPRLHTPRLASPRPRVPAGSVAIGGEHTGVYSIASPGGWNLIGHTAETLFDPHAGAVETMFRLRAGDHVRWRALPAGETGPATRLTESTPERLARPTSSAVRLRILSPGIGASRQDLGRPGFSRFGVPPGGAMDPAAAAWANRLLDNPAAAAGLELCLQGQRLEVLTAGWLAVAGSTAPRGRERNSAFRVSAGEVLEFPPGPAGVWTYLAVPGGFGGKPVLGSLSANPRAGLGQALGVGEILTGASAAPFQPPSAVASRRVVERELPDWKHPAPLQIWPGPQWAAFSPADRTRFFAEAWTVSSQCDRVGYRLTGVPLHPEPAQILSEPVLPGSIQVPANGQPIVTQPDGPTLGGYPKLGLLAPAELARLAQFRSGQRVRFALAAGA